MTCITFFSQNNKIIGFEISGHTGFAEEGADILCAAVSSAAFMAANTVTEIMHINAKEQVKDGYLKFTVPYENADDCNFLLAGFKLHIEGLCEQYNDNLKVISTEV